jgi:TRAP-type mannitol/chloroaromatic compound transport system permease small subunit
MKGWLGVAAAIDRVSYAFGWIASWLVLFSVLISAGNALSRYLFSISSNAWLEIQWQLFAGIFLLGAPYVLCVNGHVRVDLFYGSAGPRRKLWIDVFGIICFLFPVMLTLTYFAWGFFWPSFQSGETSSNTGGLILWPVKSLMPLGFALVLLQGVSELIKRIAGLRGLVDEPVEYEKPLQ